MDTSPSIVKITCSPFDLPFATEGAEAVCVWRTCVLTGVDPSQRILSVWSGQGESSIITAKGAPCRIDALLDFQKHGTQLRSLADTLCLDIKMRRVTRNTRDAIIAYATSVGSWDERDRHREIPSDWQSFVG